MAKNDRIRSLEEALADHVAKYEEDPQPERGRMIRQLELEIAERKGTREKKKAQSTRPDPGPTAAGESHRFQMQARRRGRRKVDTPHPVDIHVGSRVRLRRRELGMSQSDLAAELGVSYQQVQKFERAVNRFSAGQLYHVSNVLGVEVPFFYEGCEPTEAFEPDPLVHPDTIRLIEAFFAINDPELRRHLLDLVRTLAGERTRRRDRPSRCPC